MTLPETEEGYSEFLKWSRQKNQEHFFIALKGSRDLAGLFQLMGIVRGYLQSASIAYCAFVPHDGKGLVRQGIKAGINYAFRDLRLHRLEAQIQPENERSIHLISGLGFHFEGCSRKFLKVSGRWRDHERWSVLASEWKPSRT